MGGEEIRIGNHLVRRWTNWHRVYASGQGTRASTFDYIVFYYLASGEKIKPTYMDGSHTKVDYYTAYDRFDNVIGVDKRFDYIRSKVKDMLRLEYIKRMR